jgi:DNA-binding transcriptional LysR family regulator
VRLFHRNTRCINLTHEGKAFLESCRRIFSELRSVEDELAQTKGAPKGKLRVSMPLNGMLMVPTLGDFIRAYPDIDLDIDFTDSFVDVVDGGYDVVLRSGEVSDSRLKSRRLGTYQFEIIGSPDYFARDAVPGPARWRIATAELLGEEGEHFGRISVHTWIRTNQRIPINRAPECRVPAHELIGDSNVGFAPCRKDRSASDGASFSPSALFLTTQKRVRFAILLALLLLRRTEIGPC